MSQDKEELEKRLRKARIDPDVFAELIWDRIKGKVIPMLRDMAKQHGTKREAIVTAAVNGLMVNWTTECSAQRVAEIAERVADAVMKQEERRTGV